MTSVLLVDDQPAVRQGLRLQIRLEPDLSVVGEAGSATEAIILAHDLLPDLVVMDVELPDMDGIAATETILSLHPRCAVLILTIHDDPATRARALAAGARAFVAKGSPASLRAGLRSVLEGASGGHNHVVRPRREVNDR